MVWGKKNKKPRGWVNCGPARTHLSTAARSQIRDCGLSPHPAENADASPTVGFALFHTPILQANLRATDELSPEKKGRLRRERDLRDADREHRGAAE